MPPPAVAVASSSSSGGMSPPSSSSSPSSMLRPSLIMRWRRPANWLGSSRAKPEVRREVSNRSQTRSLTVLSPLAWSALTTSSRMMAWSGLISMVFLETMYIWEAESRRAWARMMRSMLADQPNSPVTSTQGESTMRSETTTFSTLSPRVSLISLQRPSVRALTSSLRFFSSSESSSWRPSLVTEVSFLPSYSLSCWTMYSSMGSTIRSTSRLRLRRASRKGAFSRAFLDSPVM
mmetsp:Transcript_36274/g.82670  ORF Transcript_36274/g.82670 Transcript_36274/m.82670 type:complete len:234 (-) Transcript_36274:1448-2149(-)